jgi:hypothetical protein
MIYVKFHLQISNWVKRLNASAATRGSTTSQTWWCITGSTGTGSTTPNYHSSRIAHWHQSPIANSANWILKSHNREVFESCFLSLSVRVITFCTETKKFIGSNYNFLLRSRKQWIPLVETRMYTFCKLNYRINIHLLNKCSCFVHRKIVTDADNSESAAVPRSESELCGQRCSSGTQLHIL